MRRIDIFFVLLIVLGVVFLGVVWWRILVNVDDEVVYESGGGNMSKMVVDVSGEVARPGVYEFTEGERVKDALVIAGGLSVEADRDFVDKTINMADKLKDGQKIYIPRVGSEVNPQGVLVNVNKASVAELDALWGVGESRAKAIIDARPYASLEELVNKGVMPKNVFDRNVSKMSVY